MIKNIFQSLRNSSQTLIIGCLGVIYLVFVISNYLYYGAEGIFLNGLVRLLNEKPYFSGFSVAPFALSTYFPTAYVLYFPFGKLFQVESPQAAAYVVRVLSPLYYLGYYLILKSIVPRCSKEPWNPVFVQIGFLFFVFKEFTQVFCFKPDTHALFIEVIGFVLTLIYIKEKHLKLLVLAAICFAVAALLKINMIGLGLGAGLGLLLTKRLKDFAIFSLTGLLILFGGLLSIYYWMGPSLFWGLIETTGSDVLSLSAVPGILNRIFFQILIPYLVILYLIITSFFHKHIWSPHQKVLLLTALCVSFLLASVGQFKYGADKNYFYEFLLISIFLSGFGYNSFRSLQKHQTVRDLQLLLLVFSIGMCSLLPLQILSNDLKNYDFVSMNQFLDENYRDAKIYTEHNNASTHLGLRSQLGSGFFAFFNATKSIRARTKELSKILIADGPIDVFVATTSDCQNFQPDPRFKPLLQELTHLVYKKGKICIFAETPSDL